MPTARARPRQPTLTDVIKINAITRRRTCISHLKFVLPSLHPHSLTRVVSCLCPTDFYTEWSTYRTLLFTPLMALRHCGEWASTSVCKRGKEQFLFFHCRHWFLHNPCPSYIIIIPQKWQFVKGFLKYFSKIFDGLLYSSVQGVEPFASCGTRCHLASPLDCIYIISQEREKVNIQNAQTFRSGIVHIAGSRPGQTLLNI